MPDSVGFRSQQFGEQVAQRRDRYREAEMQSWQQLPAQIQQGFATHQAAAKLEMEKQQHNQHMQVVSSQLALDELRMKQAQQELMQAEMLNADEMRDLARREAAAKVRLIEVQTRKAEDDINGTMRLNQPIDVRMLAAHEWKLDPTGGNRLVRATPEEAKAARDEILAEEKALAEEENARKIQVERERSAVVTDRMLGVERLKAENRYLIELLRQRGDVRADTIESLQREMRNAKTPEEIKKISDRMSGTSAEAASQLSPDSTMVEYDKLAMDVNALEARRRTETDAAKLAGIESDLSAKMARMREIIQTSSASRVNMRSAADEFADVINEAMTVLEGM